MFVLKISDHAVWICIIQGAWQQVVFSALQDCEVKCALPLGQPSILLLMKLLHS